MPGTPAPQPATPPVPLGARPGPHKSVRAVHRGMAVTRMVFLIAVTGFIVAAVLASVFAGIVIAINGRLP